MLLDLIENAHNYSPEEAPIELVLRKDTENPAIDVIDHGIGIPPKELETVFERFQRASNAPYKQDQGSGFLWSSCLLKEWAAELRWRAALEKEDISPCI